MFTFPNFNREHAKTKKCWMEAIKSDCKFPSDFFEAIKFDWSTTILSAPTIGILGQPEMISAMA